jgi:hypothetical protein
MSRRPGSFRAVMRAPTTVSVVTGRTRDFALSGPNPAAQRPGDADPDRELLTRLDTRYRDGVTRRVFSNHG